MEKTKKIILIITSILAIIAIILGIILIQNITKLDSQNIENTENNEIELEGIELVKDNTQYYSILNIISGYYMNIGQKNADVIYNILDKDYISKQNINIDNIMKKVESVNGENPYYTVQKMYTQNSPEMVLYYISGRLQNDMFEKEYKNTYLIIYVDNNKTYAIEPIEEVEYKNIVNTGKKSIIKTINQNENNEYSTIAINDETITTRLLYNYKSLVQKDIQEAFNKLDEGYRKAKFNNNIDEFKQYVDDTNMKYIMLSKYSKSRLDDYTQYICIDQNGKYYIFKETSVMQYTIILDTYTIDLPEFTKKYQKASNEERVLINIQRFFDAINDGDYKYAYSKLDSTYKNNNFKTQSDFERYVNTNWFTTNKLTPIDVQKQGEVYLYNINISDNSGKDKKAINKNFVMQLTQGTDFVMSFSI